MCCACCRAEAGSVLLAPVCTGGVVGLHKGMSLYRFYHFCLKKKKIHVLTLKEKKLILIIHISSQVTSLFISSLWDGCELSQ